MSFAIQYHYVFRDAIQSLFGTSPSAEEMIETAQNVGEYGAQHVQTGGGTFFDLFAKKGRDEWQQIETLINHFKEQDVKQTALIRGDFLFGYEPQPYDVIHATVFEYAKMGMNELQNFHGMNDHRALVGVAKAVQEAKAAGYDISARGVICIEDNPNITIESCMAHADKLIELGHEGFYLKSASGVVDDDFVYELTAALYEKYPEQSINIHVHATYGMAEPAYVAAARAAKEANKPIMMDVQTPAFHGPTSHPDILEMNDIFAHDPDFADHVPEINASAIEADAKASYELRFTYRDTETSTNPKVQDAMLKARVPGGASTTLKSTPGLVENLSLYLGTSNWDEIQIAIYEMQAEILDDIGNPTQVTPYAKNTTDFAVRCLMNEGIAKANATKANPSISKEELNAVGKSARYSSLTDGIANYLVGKHGQIGVNVNPDLVEAALKHKKLENPITLTRSTDLDGKMQAAARQLKAAGITTPSTRQEISASTHGDIKHIIAVDSGTNTPQAAPQRPFYARPPAEKRHQENLKDVRDAVQAIGGAAALQELGQHVSALQNLTMNGIKELQEPETTWVNMHMNAIADFIGSIDEKLKNADFTPIQSMTQHGALVQQFAGAINSLDGAIKDALEAKGPGLHEFMQAILQNMPERTVKSEPERIAS